MKPQKRTAAIHDISGFGKCSLTVALPILSAAGVETSVIPTAVLSTHTGGIDGFTYRDLTKDMLPFAQHWADLKLHFDSIYSGYLGSFEQIEIVSEIFKLLRSEDTLIMVDPVMADGGELYKCFDMDFAKEMRKLCSMADIITPNVTEACLLTKTQYKHGPYSKEYINSLLEKLAQTGAKNIVITGIYFDSEHLGAAAYSEGKISYALTDKIDGFYCGTGDVFASVLLAALMNDIEMSKSLQIAVEFTADCIKRTKAAGTDNRFGVNFEAGLPKLMKALDLM
ncbi:MAG: pyridoxamine kinase [Clostridia bacterium]|nr:pyridoxamine kinase [Clostridia bacterium]